jgi:putative ubiquitin-RnfH superfamily antitoxin RatB of RatAB toxin-antitoxin module
MVFTAQRRQSETAILRAGVLDLGAQLGLERDRVEAFGQAITGRALRRCGRAELHHILLAYAAVARRVRAATTGCAATPEEG